MEASKVDPLIQPSNTQDYPVLTPLLNRRRKIYVSSVLLLAAATVAVFALWPSDPVVKIARLRLLHIRIHRHPHIAIDISLAAVVRVQNRDFYSIDYTSLDVVLGYRGETLGHVTSGGDHVIARGSSYVDVSVDLHGVHLISDWIYLLHDLTKGLIPLDTLTLLDASIGVFLFHIPLKAKISCELDVNIKNQTVSRQNCYRDAS